MAIPLFIVIIMDFFFDNMKDLKQNLKQMNLYNYRD